MQKMENEIFVGRASSITGGGDGLSQPFRLREHGRESPSCGLGVPTSAGSVAFFRRMHRWRSGVKFFGRSTPYSAV